MGQTDASRSSIQPFKEISALLSGGKQSEFEKRLISVLKESLFNEPEGLTSERSAALSYERLRNLKPLLALNPDDIQQVSRDFLALHELVSVVDGTLATILTIHFNLCMGTILSLGDRDTSGEILTELLEFRSIGVFLGTELGYGNNVVSLRTEAVFDRKRAEFVINTNVPEAQKFMPNTGAPGVPKLSVTLARLICDGKDHGVFPFIVRIRDGKGKTLPGVRVTPLGQKPGYALDNAVTSFENVRIPFHHALLGKENSLGLDGRFESSIPSMRQRFLNSIDRIQTGKLCLSGTAIKGAQASLQIALRYSAQRKTFAPKRQEVPILSYMNQQMPLYSGLAATVATTIMYRKAHALLERGGQGGSKAVNRYLALTKVLCTYSAQSVFLSCRERIGAQGLFSCNKIITYSNQVHGLITAEGDNQILLIKTAREMLLGEEYQRLPRATAIFGSPAIESLAGQQRLLQERERLLEKDLRGKLARAKLLGADLFSAWNDNVNQAIEMATAHAHRLAHQAFCEAVERVNDEEERQALTDLGSLYGLGLLASSGAWLVAHRLVSRRKWKSLEAESLRLCRKIHPDQEKWMSSFSIPDELLRSPLLSDCYIDAHDFMNTESTSAKAPLAMAAVPANSR